MPQRQSGPESVRGRAHARRMARSAAQTQGRAQCQVGDIIIYIKVTYR